MAIIDSLDELIDYVEEKGISTYKLATASGYSRSYVRNVTKGGFPIKQEGLEILIEAALEIGEQVTFNRREMELLKELSTGDPLPMCHWTKPSSMTAQQWKIFLGKLS